MSDVRWTAEQEQAITARGADVLVAAAAGSGKTAVLVERIIRRLIDQRDPLDVDQLLVVTFTEADATEMRDRIGAALQAALAGDPENGRLNGAGAAGPGVHQHPAQLLPQPRPPVLLPAGAGPRGFGDGGARGAASAP